MKNSTLTQTKASGNIRFTAGERLPGGGALELVASADGLGSPQLLLWRDGKAVIAPEVEYQGETFRAMPMPPEFAKSLLLPSRARGAGEIRPIFEQMCRTLQNLCALPEAQAEIVGFWAISTWFADGLVSSPALSVYGPNMTRAMQLFQVLRRLCRRGLLLGGLTSGRLQTLPWALRPTLLLSQPSRSAQKLLLASSFRGLLVPVAGRDVQDFCCAKAIFTGSRPLPPLWATQTIYVALSPLDDSVLWPSERGLAQATDFFQSRLLAYRLNYWREVRKSRFVASGLPSPLREVASVLGACIQGDDKLARQFVASVPEKQDKRSDILDLALLEILWPRLHRQAADRAPLELRVKTDLTKEINTYVLAAGDSQEFSAESVGSRIALLGFDTRRDKRGSKLRLTPQTGRRLHQLASKLDPLKRVPGCPDCEQMFADRERDTGAEVGIDRGM